MTPADLHARRRALGLTVRQLAYATAISNDRIIHAADTDLARLDAALRVLETGGTIEDARALAQPGKPGTKPRVSRETPAPSWPAHDGYAAGQAHLSGQCFADVPTHDDRGRLPQGEARLRPMRPATAVLQSTTLGN